MMNPLFFLFKLIPVSFCLGFIFFQDILKLLSFADPKNDLHLASPGFNVNYKPLVAKLSTLQVSIAYKFSGLWFPKSLLTLHKSVQE